MQTESKENNLFSFHVHSRVAPYHGTYLTTWHLGNVLMLGIMILR
jgi:hypothetical protein